MPLKVYGVVRSFPDGDGSNIIFKASGNLFPLYKSFAGKDLIAAYDDYVTLSQKNGAEIEKKTGRKLEELRALPRAEMNEMIADAKVQFQNDGSDFTNSILLATFLNGLTTQEQNEALALGLDCLPAHFYTDFSIIESVLEMTTEFLTNTKKN